MSIELFSIAWKINFQGRPLKKLVLLSLADQANDRDGYCWPTYETIAKRCGMNRRTVINTVAELEREGFIRRESRYKVGGLHASNAFWVNQQAMLAAVAVEANGDLRSPQPAAMVNDDHHNGDLHAPSMVIVDHPNGDPRSPRTSIEPSTEPKEEPPTAPAPPAAPAASAPAAVAAADPLAPILDWIEFDDALTPKERTTLDPPTLLAWAYWVKLKSAESGSRIHNPVGLVRAQWRSGKRPRVDLLALARGWLALDDLARGRLLGRLEWVIDYAQSGYPGDSRLDDDEFPSLPLATAAAVYAATGGELGPPEFMPTRVIPPPTPPPAAPPPVTDRSPLTTDPWPHWPAALAELEMQMTRATFATWLRGSTAVETPDGLTVHVANDHAVDWLANRLHPIVQRTVDAVAGRPLPVTYRARQDTPAEARP